MIALEAIRTAIREIIELPRENRSVFSIAELSAEQPRVNALGCKQVCMTAFLDDSPAIDDYDAISALHRAQTVSNAQRRPPLKQRLHCLLDESLTLTVE